MLKYNNDNSVEYYSLNIIKITQYDNIIKI